MIGIRRGVVLSRQERIILSKVPIANREPQLVQLRFRMWLEFNNLHKCDQVTKSRMRQAFHAGAMMVGLKPEKKSLIEKMKGLFK